MGELDKWGKALGKGHGNRETGGVWGRSLKKKSGKRGNPRGASAEDKNHHDGVDCIVVFGDWCGVNRSSGFVRRGRNAIRVEKRIN